MKNITLAVEEDVLAAARKYAAANNTTVNALVREHLAQLAAFEDKAARARDELIKLSQESTLDLGSWTWNREDLYDRELLSGHERASVPGFAEPDEREKKGESD
jgi:hypothetical protein